jgi:hypothetical protein
MWMWRMDRIWGVWGICLGRVRVGVRKVMVGGEVGF